MSNKNHCKSVSFKARDMGVSEFLLKQVVHENIRYLSYKIIKGKSLSEAIKNKKKDQVAKFLTQLKAFPPTEHALVFLRWKNFCLDQLMNP